MESSQFRSWASRLFTHYSRLPTPVSATIRLKDSAESPTICSVYSKWNFLDPVRNDSIIMNKVYHAHCEENHSMPHLIHNTTSEVYSSFGSCYPYSSETGSNVLFDIENDLIRVVFTEYTLPSRALSESGPMKACSSLPGTFAHVFSLQSGGLLKTIKLPTEGSENSPACHGKLFASGGPSVPFSACRFCHSNSNRLVYLAEYKCNEAKELCDNSNVPPLKSPFVYKETWGEGLSSIIRPVICTLDLETEEVECVQSRLEKIVPDAKNWSFDEPHYTPNGNGLVFLAYDNQPYRLGLIYCYQRESRLIYWDFESSSINCLSRDGHSVRWPRFSPDYSKLIWFELPAGGPHGQCFSMVSQDWPPKHSEPKVIIPLVANPKTALDFPGLFLRDGVSERCFTADSKGVILSSIWRSERALIHVSLDPSSLGKITRFPSPLRFIKEIEVHDYGDVSLMDIKGDFMVVRASVPSVPDFLAIAKVSPGAIDATCWLNLSVNGENAHSIPFLKGLSWKVLHHTAASAKDSRFGVSDFESILIHPNMGSTDFQFSSSVEFDCKELKWDRARGLIVIPHGGPHSAFTTEYIPLLISYIASGFACLLVNYRGSTGYGNCSIYSLPGKCGENDVSDCIQATEDALKYLKMPDLPCLISGGSHGGFLVLHLAGRYPSLYRAVVARNPVTNLMSMLSTTDIPDWCWTEAGLGLDESKIDPEHPEHLCREWDYKSTFCPTDPKHLTRLAKCSPITYISSEWSVPVLMCLGAKDKRVPNEQGLTFMRALKAQLGEKANEKTCQTLCFPTEAHPIQSPAAVKDNFVRTVEWYYQALGLIKA
nr:acylamino acid releasing enzyme [Hymenolepis microstoma]